MSKSRRYTRDSTATDRALRRSAEESQASASATDKDATEPTLPKPTLLRINGLPLSTDIPNYDFLENPLTIKETGAMLSALHRSRKTWLSGAMFETFWTRPQRGRKSLDANNLRDKMTKFCDCKAQFGPHLFDIRLFTVREDPPPSAPKSTEHDRTGTSDSQATVSREETPGDDWVSQQSTASPAGTPSTIRVVPSIASAPSPATATPVGRAITPLASTTPRQVTPRPIAPQSTGTGATPSQSPRLVQPLPRNPNEGLIERLHALARMDPQFGELMRQVASGKANPQEIRRFQIYISQHKALPVPASSPSSFIVNPPIVPQRTALGLVRPHMQKHQTEYKRRDREVLRNQTLVFEFRENTGERYLIPKESLIKFLPEGNIAVSMLLLSGDLIEPAVDQQPLGTETEKKGKKRKKTEEKPDKNSKIEKAEKAGTPDPVKKPNDPPKYYTPITITFFDIPRRQHDVFMVAVKPRDIVINYMQEIMTKLKHSQDYWVYYQLEVSDADMVDKSVIPVIQSSYAKRKSFAQAKSEVVCCDLSVRKVLVYTDLTCRMSL
ncbi:uncharacterized protein V1518DRAFT_376247 [Limtongia smithiae]|uniref:uncharacterized protein n=1 Tax=Limtongia smithiae TaxID=1125753 RepID=UPI0034CF12B1